MNKVELKAILKEADAKISTGIDKLSNSAYLYSIDPESKLNLAARESIKRLEFSNKTKILLAQRVGFRCSFEGCNFMTIGPGDNENDVVILGEAAHIVGAVKGGQYSPRSSDTMDEKDIIAPSNGIWLCRHHHKLVDCKDSTFTIATLIDMKKKAEKRQSDLLEKQNSDFVEKYCFPSIRSKKGIDCARFKEADWCLLCYVHEKQSGQFLCFESDDDGRCFSSEYQNWMTKNGIRIKVSKIIFDESATYQERISSLRERIDKLCGLLSMDNNGIYPGSGFNSFCECLLNDDEFAFDKIVKKLSIV